MTTTIHDVEFMCSDGKTIIVHVTRRYYQEEEDGTWRCHQSFDLPDSVTPDDIEALIYEKLVMPVRP